MASNQLTSDQHDNSEFVNATETSLPSRASRLAADEASDGVDRMVWAEGGFEMPAVKFSISEWAAIVEADPVLSFYARVNKRALADPLWHENYTLAVYHARVAEYGQYAAKTYNDGKPFSIGDRL